MNESEHSVEELHDLLSILQFVDVGLVVLDRDFHITLWNGFMENHSGLSRSDIEGKSFFELFPDIPQEWLLKKIDTVVHLNNRSFSDWKTHPYLTKFQTYRPITGRSEFMYQNVTIFPLLNLQGEIEKVCLMIYDVTDMALHDQAIEKANEQLEVLSTIDGLTQLLNRRTWEEQLAMEYKRLQRSKGISSLVMFDIDHFKKVNDTYGHQAGDEVIRVVAAELRYQIRETDIAGRYGGEEFGIILPDTNAEGGFVLCERLREAIANSVITYDGQEIPIAISLGIAEVSYIGNSYAGWLQNSDEALYQSKEGGRNMTTVSKGPDD